MQGAVPTRAASFSLLAAVEKPVAKTVDLIAAALLAAEIGVLFTGVVSRYGLGHPLIWTDEIASTLFLWLSMFGAIAAVQRSAHLRMTTLVNRAPPGLRHFLEVLAPVVALVFLMLMVPAAFDYAQDEFFTTTTTLEISGIWRAAALPVGVCLMLFHTFVRVTECPRKTVIIAILVVVVTAGLLVACGPAWELIGNYSLAVFFLGLVSITVLSGVPIAFTFGIATAAYLCLVADAPATVLISRMTEGMSHFILLSVPLFIFLGLLIEMTGMAEAMVDLLARLIGHLRGGLSYVLLGAMCLVSGISGSKAADMAAIAPILFPEMRRRGSKPGDMVALLSASGAMTETIPPSLVLIAIGSVTGVSISALFTGGLIPALVLTAALACVIWLRSRRDPLPAVQRARPREIARAGLIALPAIVLPFIIRFAVVEGIATATEVSTVGIVYAALAGLFIYRRFPWRRLVPLLVESVTLSGSILLIVGTATAMSWAITQSGFAQSLAEAMRGLPGGDLTFLMVSIVAFIVLGSLLEGLPSIVLFGPLLFPIARQMGVHEVHYAIVVILAMGIGLFSPPFGVGYYISCAIARVDPDEGVLPIGAYLIALVIGLLIVAFVPWLSVGLL